MSRLKHNRVIDLETDLQDKQKLAWSYLDYAPKKNMIVYGGSAGSGKTHLGCLWILVNCLRYPESRWLIGRTKLTNLRQSTLIRFFELCKQYGYRSEHEYIYNAVNNTVKFYNGSMVILKDLEYKPSDPNFDNLSGLEISGAFVDETQEVDYKAINIILSRIRWKLDDFGINPKILMSCNPGKNFLYTEFYLKNRDNTLEENKAFIQALPNDNKYLPSSYISSLNNLDFHSKERLLFGNWDYADSYGLCSYDTINKIFYPERIKNDLPKDVYYMSVDPARLGKDTTVVTIANGIDRIVEIKQYPKTLGTELRDIVNQFISSYKILPSNIIVDGGGMGAPIIDFLNEKHRNIQEFVGNSSAKEDGNYVNFKTQCIYKLAETINNEELKIYVDDPNIRKILVQEMDASMVATNIDKTSKLSVVSKEQVKKNIGRSPDVFDSIMMLQFFKFRHKNTPTGRYYVESLRPNSIR